MKLRPRQLIASHPGYQYPAYRLAAAFRHLVAPLVPARVRLSCDKPMLVLVGAGRSGNTLLRRLLMEKGRIYIPPESYVWAAQINAHLRAGGLSWEDRIALGLGRLEYSPEFDTFEVASLRDFALTATNWPARDRALGQLIRELYFWLARLKAIDAVWVGDKTPMNLMRVGLIGKLFPQASFVYLERNAVDVALSYRAAGLSTDLIASIERWKVSRSAWRRFSRGLASSRKVELRYEQLVRDSDSIVPSLLDFYGIPKRADSTELAESLGDVSSRAHHRRVMESVGPPTKYDWDLELTALERRKIRRALGAIAKEVDYESL